MKLKTLLIAASVAVTGTALAALTMQANSSAQLSAGELRAQSFAAGPRLDGHHAGGTASLAGRSGMQEPVDAAMEPVTMPDSSSLALTIAGMIGIAVIALSRRRGRN